MITLNGLLEGITAGQANAFRNLELVPLMANEGQQSQLEYLLASQALEQEPLTVTEIDEEGSVPELDAVSTAGVAVLILDGEELIGAKQNRILNTDVLLRPQSKKRIPVSCVEQGRWRHVSGKFSMGKHAPSPIRARKSRSVSRSLREEQVAMSDQGEVWEDVQHCLAEMAADSPTAAMADAYEQREDDLGAFERKLSYPDGAVGVVAVINGSFTAVDLFDRPGTLEAVWPRLISGYAFDAVMKAQAAEEKQAERESTTPLDRLRDVECEVCPAVDLGEDWRFDAGGLVGSALVHEGAALHLSAFPAEPETRRRNPQSGRIASPRQRRRGRARPDRT